jgi:hypothetical protein
VLLSNNTACSLRCLSRSNFLVAVTSGHVYVFNKFQVFNTLGAQEQSGVRLLRPPYLGVVVLHRRL